MNESKQIDVNSASIIDLKAELYRKQEAFKQKKLSQSQQQIVENDRNLYEISSKQIKYKLGKRIRDKNDQELTDNLRRKYGLKTGQEDRQTEEDIELEKALQKSRQKLEMKSKLYEKWSQNPNLLAEGDDDSEEESDKRILVDFHRKVDEKQTKRRYDYKYDRCGDKSSEDESKDTKEEDEWTEFVDSLGRTRKCLKKDLQHYQDMDRNAFGKSDDNDMKKDDNHDMTSLPHLSRDNQLMTSDLKRELERREWEESARSEVAADGPSSGGTANDLNIHYQNVQNNEIRDHGVAYYAFSKDQTTRQEQLDLLNELRDQTKTRKEQKQKLKQKRKELMRQRLAKVAQRKGISYNPKESSSDSDEDFEEVVPIGAEPRPVPTSVRDWDVGKPDLPRIVADFIEKPKPKAHKVYAEERRGERNPEFAPPLAYSANKTHFKSNFRDKRNDYKRETTNSSTEYEKCENINNINERYKSDNKESNTGEPNIDEVIGSALSYFRNNPNQT